MTNHGCSVCRETIATSTRNEAKAYLVTVLPHNRWTESGIVCACGALNPFDAPAIYASTANAAILRDRTVKQSLTHGK